MHRRDFMIYGSILTGGYALLSHISGFTAPLLSVSDEPADPYSLFQDPPSSYRPFVRWWWNGDKVNKEEIARELRLLKDAGIGGVEIYPIKFPELADDMGIPSVQWLSSEWIDLLGFTFSEAKSLGLICDLLVGSGWPYGGEYLEGEERSQIVVIGVRKLEGPLEYEVSLFDLFEEADPPISSPFPGRKMEMMSVLLVPDPLNNLNEIKDLSDQIPNKTIKVNIPRGKYAIYALVHIYGFQEVINGAPGANGPVLNHFNETAVKKYLNRMSQNIQQQIGPLSKNLRSLFTDSMELEGANWCSDMPSEFKNRRGYDLMPYLPFILFKIGRMGNTIDPAYGVDLSAELNDTIQRVRYDFYLTISEVFKERFIHSYVEWCKRNNVKSRVQAYGRNYLPLEGSFDIDIPECETWIKNGVGKDMTDARYTQGAYTMINKYVSSAAHLKSKRLISCEQLTDIYSVFNVTLEICKVASDESIISGTTQPVFHGFNYSPAAAPFPGWVRYGTFINEQNPWWPYFKKFVDYNARLSALLQQGDMFADIALLPAIADTWGQYGAQNTPFPSVIYPDYEVHVWEAIHQNGDGCDYISEEVIRDARVKNGHLQYGSRKYHTIFLIKVSSLEPETAQQLYHFVSSGGRIFCIEMYPEKSPGFLHYQQKDQEVQSWVNKMKNFPERFILLNKPADNDFLQWYKDVQQKYKLIPYVHIDKPNRFISQVRYSLKKATILFFNNSNMEEGYRITISPTQDIIRGKQSWVWDIVSGGRYRINPVGENITLDLGPADSRLLVFNEEEGGPAWRQMPTGSEQAQEITGPWDVEFRHIDGSVKRINMNTLKDLKYLPEFAHFAGTVIYRKTINVADYKNIEYINLGKVHGVSELKINENDPEVQWFGRRIYHVKKLLKSGDNTIEIKIVTVLGNYMKSLKNNAEAQYWTNEGSKIQPLQSMGLIGPVTIY
ncbi:MAG: glycoside hydrolase family 2 [Acidobacterium ailaaui]|nr:glycoside hydrolase family 2 [Pseudacidobacterium ailaaui]